MFFSEDANIVPLLSVDANGRFSVSSDAREWLEAQKPVPVAVVSIVGKYRTGKSALLNRLINTENGFKVGNTVQACTKGLWVYRDLVATPDERVVLFIDTEGIASLDANCDHDTKIMTAALLLSSMLVYNAQGPIDEAALQSLSIMLRISRELRATSNGGTLGGAFPHLAWVMRDLALRLETPNGTPLTADQYIETALVDPPDGAERSEIRACLRECFTQRNAFVLPRPCDDAHLTRLDDNPALASAAFHKQVGEMRGWLMSTVTPLTVEDETGGASVTPAMFAVLCGHVADALNQNKMPVLGDAWKLMNQIHARDRRDALHDGAVAEFQTLERAGLRSEEELESSIGDVIERATALFAADCPQADDVLRALRDKLAGMASSLRDRNLERARELADSAAQDVLSELPDAHKAVAAFLRHDSGGVFRGRGSVRSCWMEAAVRTVPTWLKAAAAPSPKVGELEQEARTLRQEVDKARIKAEETEARAAGEMEAREAADEQRDAEHQHALRLAAQQTADVVARARDLEEQLVRMSAAVPSGASDLGDGTPEKEVDADEIATLRATTSALSDEVEQLRSQESAAQAEVSRVHREHSQVTDELRVAQLRIEQHSSELDTLMKRHDEQLTAAYAQLKEQSAAAHAKEEELSQHLAAARNDAEDARASKERITASYESTQQLLQEKINAEVARAADFERRYHEALGRELEVVKEREARQREHDEERLKLRMGFSEREAGYIRTATALETEARLLRKRSAEAAERSEQVKVARRELEVVARDLVRLRAERDNMETRKNELQADVSRMQAQTQTLMRDNAALSRECELMKSSR
jgi:hypothetical protein